jgi:hypothetical protein
MQNPYTPIGNDDLSHCPNSWRFREWLAWVVLIGLAVHGIVDVLEDIGVIVWYDGEQHFWFEERLRRWIHARN